MENQRKKNIVENLIIKNRSKFNRFPKIKNQRIRRKMNNHSLADDFCGVHELRRETNRNLPNWVKWGP